MKKRNFAAKLYLALVLVLMYLPVLVVIVYSFNSNASRQPIPHGYRSWSKDHYQK